MEREESVYSARTDSDYGEVVDEGTRPGKPVNSSSSQLPEPSESVLSGGDDGDAAAHSEHRSKAGSTSPSSHRDVASERSGKRQSSQAHSHALSHRSASERYTESSRAPSEGGGGHEASLALSGAASEPRSKSPSVALPSAKGQSRQASEAGGGRSARPSAGLSGMSYDLTATGDISLGDGGGGGVSGAKAPSKPASVAPGARSARPSAVSGLSQDLTGLTGDISLGGNTGAKGSNSRQASEGGGARSARPSAISGLSQDLTGATGDISYGDAAASEAQAAAPTPPVRRRSSLASSLRQSVAASQKAASHDYSDDAEAAHGNAAAVSRSQSQLDEDAASRRSGASASASAASAKPSPRSSSRSAPSAPPAAPASVKSAKSRYSESVEVSVDAADKASAQYSQSGFEEEEVAAGSEGEEVAGTLAPASAYSESVADASESVATASASAPLRGGSVRSGSAARGSASVASGGTRRSSHNVQPPAGASAPSNSGGEGYSQESFDAASASVTPSHPTSAAAPAADGAADPATSGSIVNSSYHGAGGVSGAGSIFQPHHSSVGGTPSGSVFRRLPADAPDDASLHSSPSAREHGAEAGADAAEVASQGGATEGGAPSHAVEWNEGAIRVPSRRMYGAQREVKAPPRSMSIAARDRQSAQLVSITRKHPATWDPIDVATWVEFIGLGQYRRKFLHHLVDGRLLLRMNDAQLKTDLGIGPIGHRVAIIDAASVLEKNYYDVYGNPDEQGSPGAEASRQEYRPGSAPRLRGRPASAMPGGVVGPRRLSPPRRPASASPSVIPPDPYLGPGKGKMTVYEQRAKLLFELDRAQMRAEQHRVLAEQLRHTAHLSKEEVAHLRGLLVDIEMRNKTAFGLSSNIDMSARVPWRHVGAKTTPINRHPERFARPGEPDFVDLTFHPACPSAESKRLLSGGSGSGEYDASPNPVNSFLDRLNNDLRKREQTRKELERRYYSDGSNMTQAESDWNTVAEALAGRCRIQLERDPAAYEAQIDEALGTLSSSESWREAGLKAGPILVAKGPAKLAATASALRSLAFMERYRSDLKTRSGKISSLEKKWISQTLGDRYLPAARDKEDLAQAVQFFALLGWREDDGRPSEEAVADYLLDRLLERAMEYRSRFDAWFERVRERPQERAAGFKPDIDWNAPPWDTDGLAPPMMEEMDRMAACAEEAATIASPGGTLTRGSVEVAPAALGTGMDFVEFTVRLLGKCRLDDLRRIKKLGAQQKRLAVYRAIRTQKFIEFTERDLEERERKLRQAYTTLAPPRRKIPASRIEGFFERLHEDGARRRARAEALAHEKMAKEREILASSVMYGRPRSAR